MITTFQETFLVQYKMKQLIPFIPFIPFILFAISAAGCFVPYQKAKPLEYGVFNIINLNYDQRIAAYQAMDFINFKLGDRVSLSENDGILIEILSSAEIEARVNPIVHNPFPGHLIEAGVVQDYSLFYINKDKDIRGENMTLLIAHEMLHYFGYLHTEKKGHVMYPFSDGRGSEL